jgi:hypothetical protein
MPRADDVQFDKYIYAGCIIDHPMKEWDCMCYLESDSEIIVADIRREIT